MNIYVDVQKRRIKPFQLDKFYHEPQKWVA